jgi:hypothetical protein
VKRALVAGGAATLIWVAIANSLPVKQARAADWSQPKAIGTPGITATYPRDWHVAIQAGPSLGFSVDRSVTVQAFVGLGPGARKSDAVELLDRLTIRRSSPSLART